MCIRDRFDQLLRVVLAHQAHQIEEAGIRERLEGALGLMRQPTSIMQVLPSHARLLDPDEARLCLEQARRVPLLVAELAATVARGREGAKVELQRRLASRAPVL